MPTVSITFDMGCCRCRAKFQKVLSCLQERCGFVFDKVEYDKDKVLVSGPFDAVDLCCKLRCKTRCFAAKIEIVPPPPPKKKKKKKDPPPKSEPTCKALYLCQYPHPCPSPCPDPQPACPCQCHSCTPPPPCPKPKPPPPCPSPPPPCPAPPPPGPEPPQPPAVVPPLPCHPPVCNKCPTWTPCQCRGYPWVVCCEDNLPSDGLCAVM